MVNFDVIKDMILGKTDTEQVTVHTEKKTNRKRKAGGSVVSIIPEPEDKLYKIFFQEVATKRKYVIAVWV